MIGGAAKGGSWRSRGVLRRREVGDTMCKGREKEDELRRPWIGDAVCKGRATTRGGRRDVQGKGKRG